MGGMQDSGRTVLVKRTWVDKGEMDESGSATLWSRSCLRASVVGGWVMWCVAGVGRRGSQEDESGFWRGTNVPRNSRLCFE